MTSLSEAPPADTADYEFDEGTELPPDASSIMARDLRRRENMLANRPDLTQTPTDYIYGLLLERQDDLRAGFTEAPDDPRLQMLMLGYTAVIAHTIGDIPTSPVYEKDDLYLIGLEELHTCLGKFDPNKGDFVRYLIANIRLRIIDEYRAVSPGAIRLSRRHYKLVNDIDRVKVTDPHIDDEQLAATLEIPLSTLHQMMGELYMMNVASYDDTPDDMSDPYARLHERDQTVLDPCTVAGIREMHRVIIKTLDALPLNRRERDVLSEHLLGDMTQSELGRVFGVTESRVTQLATAVRKIIRANNLLQQTHQTMMELRIEEDST